MRSGKWKLLDWVKELYDLETDPEERNNIYDEHPDVVAAMMGSIAQWEATLPNVHARLPDEPYPFDPSVPWKVIGPPAFLLVGESSEIRSLAPSSGPTSFPQATFSTSLSSPQEEESSKGFRDAMPAYGSLLLLFLLCAMF